jgi:hypothetical protein
MCADRCRVDDRAAAGLDHQRHDVFHHQPGALEIDLDGSVERLLGDLDERQPILGIDAGVVEQHVWQPQLAVGPLSDAFHILGAGDVRCDGNGVSPFGADLLHVRLHGIFLQIHQRHLRALTREQQRRRFSHPSGSAGHDRDLVLQSHGSGPLRLETRYLRRNPR